MAVPDCTTRACAGQYTPLVDGPDSLNSSARPTLEQMKAVEEMRRTLREVRLRLQLRAAASAGPPSAGQASRSSSELCKRERRLAGWTGLEPAASAVTGQRSNQLNYHPLRGLADFRLLMSDVTELSPLDLDSTISTVSMVGGKGLEPLTAGV